MSDSISACADAEDRYIARCKRFGEEVQYRDGFADWTGEHAKSLGKKMEDENKDLLQHVIDKIRPTTEQAAASTSGLRKASSESAMDVEARVAAMVWCEACEAHGVYVRPVNGGDRIDCSKCGAILGATMATPPRSA